MRDIYLYPDADVLINKFDIKDNKKLNTLEADYTSMRLKELYHNPVSGIFDFEHLCKTHQYIFQDIYDWAGQQRKLNIEKSEDVLGGLSIEYADVSDIQKQGSSILSKMNDVEWDKLDISEKANVFSKHMADLWKVHPFREGNTRSIITFCCDFAEKKGFPLDKNLFKDNSKYVRTALVAATAKFNDSLGDKSKPEYLFKIVHNAIKNGDSHKYIKDINNPSEVNTKSYKTSKEDR